MDFTVKNIKGKDTKKKVTLNKSIFGIKPIDHAIYLDVKQYLANQRQGTSKSKERNEIIGSRKKIKKQKGTGTARAGDIKNPLFRGGGRVFGPKPRDYGFKLNKKVKKLARRSALSLQFNNGNITIVEDFTFDAPKTKNYLDVLSALNFLNEKTLLISKESDNNLYLSSRNLRKASVTSANSLSTYSILDASKVIISEGSLEKINELLG